MSAPNRKGMGLGLGDALLVWLAIGFVVVFGGGTYAALHVGSWMAGIETPPAHPIDLIAGLAKGRVPWPTQATIAAWAMAGLILVLAIVVSWRGERVRPSVPGSTRPPGTWAVESHWLRSRKKELRLPLNASA